MVEIAARAANAIFLKQLHHQGEYRRLGAAEIVGAVAVGNVAVGFNHPGEVVGHTFEQIFTAAFRQTQHGEVGIPVVGLAKTPAGDDVRLR